MAQRPAPFGTLKKTKATVAVIAPAKAPPPAPKPRQADRIQTSVRLDPAIWAALNDLATRKRVETGKRVTLHDLLIEGAHHILELNGSKLPR